MPAGMGHPQPPWATCSVRHHPLGEKLPPHLQPKPPLSQFKTIPPCPITVHPGKQPLPLLSGSQGLTAQPGLLSCSDCCWSMQRKCRALPREGSHCLQCAVFLQCTNVIVCLFVICLSSLFPLGSRWHHYVTQEQQVSKSGLLSASFWMIH